MLMHEQGKKHGIVLVADAVGCGSWQTSTAS
jgi:hypothetical protein